MPVGERAHVLVRGEILPQPFELPGSRTAATHPLAVRVQRDEVPRTRVERVVVAMHLLPEIREVAGRAPVRLVLVVPECRRTFDRTVPHVVPNPLRKSLSDPAGY